MSRFRQPLMLSILTTTLLGCASGADLGGSWRVLDQPLLGDKIIHDAATGKPDVGIELLIGHYGPDVAGLVRFYRSNAFQFRRSAVKPDSDCACTFMHNGHAAANSDRIEFDLRGCVPGAATASTLLLRAELQLDASGQLDGKVTVLDANSVLEGWSQKWTFARVTAAGAVDSSDLICETPDLNDGNIFNGL